MLGLLLASLQSKQSLGLVALGLVFGSLILAKASATNLKVGGAYVIVALLGVAGVAFVLVAEAIPTHPNSAFIWIVGFASAVIVALVAPIVVGWLLAMPLVLGLRAIASLRR